MHSNLGFLGPYPDFVTGDKLELCDPVYCKNHNLGPVKCVLASHILMAKSAYALGLSKLHQFCQPVYAWGHLLFRMHLGKISVSLKEVKRFKSRKLFSLGFYC